jgi:hypothetical protein
MVLPNNHDALVFKGLLKSTFIHEIGEWVDTLVCAFITSDGKYLNMNSWPRGKVGLPWTCKYFQKDTTYGIRFQRPPKWPYKRNAI